MSENRADTIFEAEYEVALYDRKGRLTRTVRLSCPTDEAALEAVAHIPHPNALELWEGNRLLWRFEARPLG